MVVQNAIGNEHSPITIGAVITSKFDEPLYPTEVIMEPEESGLSLRSGVALNKIRSIDPQPLVKRLGRASGRTMNRVDQAIPISLGDSRLRTVSYEKPPRRQCEDVWLGQCGDGFCRQPMRPHPMALPRGNPSLNFHTSPWSLLCW